MNETDDKAANAGSTTESLSLLSKPLARPWPRYWARIFDIALLSVLVGFLIHWGLPEVFGEQAVIDPAYDGLLSLALLPVIFVLDAVIQTAFGNTPGKFIAGIRVLTTDERRPSLGQSINRNLLVWIKGFAFGIPIVSLFSLVACFMTAKEGRLTSWDTHNRTRVFAKSSNFFRTLLTFVAALILAASLAALNLISLQGAAIHSPAEIAKANEGLPLQLDDKTRIDKVEVVDGLVTYSYSLVDAQGAPSLTPMQVRALKAQVPALVLPTYCRGTADNPQALPTYPVRYLYRNVEGQIVIDFISHPKDCASAAP